jgi:TatD DNase family protein
MAAEFFDTHAHLTDEAFRGGLDAALARAREAGVSSVVAVGTSLDDSAAAVALAGGREGVYAAIGVHPNESASAPDDFAVLLKELARRPKVVAIGETGLDYYRDRAPKESQLRLFEGQIALAGELGLPFIVHCREAMGDVMEVLRRSAAGGRLRGVMHCFSGNMDEALACIDLGLMISFAGPVTYPKGRRLREAAAGLPAQSILIETDCPWLPPQSVRGQCNEPARVCETAAAVAEARGISLDAAAAITAKNARRLFGT